MKDFKVTDKFINYTIVISLIIILLICIVINISYSYALEIKIDENLENVQNVKFKIENMEKENTKLYIKGFAYKEGEDVKNFKNSIIIKNIENNKYYKIPTSMKINNDLKKDYDYSRGGFEAKINLKTLKSGEYEIYILYQSNKENTVIKTNENISI